jgi:hypothetical protein
LLGFVDKDLLLVRARLNPAGRQSEIITIESISESSFPPPPYIPLSLLFRTSFASEGKEKKKKKSQFSSLIKPFMSFRTDLSIQTKEEFTQRRRKKKILKKERGK